MTVSGIPVTAPDTANSLPGFSPNELGQREFLHLLVTQLRHQDPMKPMDDQEFIAQMAQFTSLEATTGLAEQVGHLLAAQQRMQALQLVGREIEYLDGSGATQRGLVSGARLGGAEPLLMVGSEEIPAGNILSVA